MKKQLELKVVVEVGSEQLDALMKEYLVLRPVEIKIAERTRSPRIMAYIVAIKPRES